MKQTKKINTKRWSKMSPKKGKERSKMLKKCGTKCFLGKKKSFPICNKFTCKINNKGIFYAYLRAKQQLGRKNISKKNNYKKIVNKSKKMLIKK